MFGGKNDKGNRAVSNANSRDTAVTILTSGCHFSGKLYCRGSCRIGGRIEGQIISEGLLIIEEEAVINAEIEAEEAVVQGTITGKIKAKHRAELCSTARFEGDIQTPSLIIQEGAQFNGHASMPASGTASTDKGRLIEAGKHGKKIPEIKAEKSRLNDHPEVAAMTMNEPTVTN